MKSSTLSLDRSPVPAPSSAWRRNLLVRRVSGYLLAFTLPFLDSWLTGQSFYLTSIPFALYYITVSAVTLLGGVGPGIIAVILSIVARNVLINHNHSVFVWLPGDWLRVGTLLLASLSVLALDRRLRRSVAQLESAHNELEERTSALIESLHASKCASWRIDFNASQAAHWYSGSYPVFGIPIAELNALPTLLPLSLPEDRPLLFAARKSMLESNDPLRVEHRVTWPGGDVHWLEMHATRVPGPGCVWRGITGDITERKRTEATLLRSEKLAAMGRLASTVAHEINNPLESVTNLLYLAHSDPGLSSETRSYIATAEQELARLGEITRLTLGFVRSSGMRRNLALAPVAEEVLRLFCRRLESKNILVECVFDHSAEAHIADHELRQILTNLLSNAVDAFPSPAALSGPQSVIRLCIARQGVDATLILEDNGSGIPESVLPQIFDPFFTTKHAVGTGIGLWVTRELIESAHGRISAESGDLEGGMKTRFQITFSAATNTLQT